MSRVTQLWFFLLEFTNQFCWLPFSIIVGNALAESVASYILQLALRYISSRCVSRQALDFLITFGDVEAHTGDAFATLSLDLKASAVHCKEKKITC